MLVNQKPFYRQLTEEDYQLMAGPDWPTYQEFSTGQPLEEFVADEIDGMLDSVNEKKKKLSNFCVLPFYGREYPSNIHCCLLPKDYDIQSIQQDMLENRRNPQCGKCWKLEDAGLLSDRQVKNFTLDFYTDTDLLYLFDQCEKKQNKITHYKVSAGNFCNATCVTCNDESSTAWGDLLKSPENQSSKKIAPLKILKKDNEKIKIDYVSARFIGFTGGESTMIRTHWDILENLDLAGNNDCCISFTTNGSFELTPRQKTLLSKFKSVNFNFSIDGVGRVFEYLRFPLSWEKTLSNIDWACDQGYLISAMYTINNLNIFYHEQTIEWFKTNQIRYLENPVYDPVYFHARSLSQKIKNKILSSTNDTLVTSLLKNHSDSDDLNYQEFLKQIKFQDSLKKIDVRDYLPEFWNLVDNL